MTDVSGYCPSPLISLCSQVMDEVGAYAEILGESGAGLCDVVRVDSTVDEGFHQLGVAVRRGNITLWSDDPILDLSQYPF